MSRRFRSNKEPEDSIKKETKEEPKEESFAERRRRRIAEREKLKQKEKEKENTEKEEIQLEPPKEEPKEEKKEPIRYTRRFRTSNQQKPKEEEKPKQEEIKQEEIPKDKNNSNNNDNIDNKKTENDNKILEMKKQYDKIKQNNKDIIQENEGPKKDEEEKDKEENIDIDISGQAFNNKLEELSKLAKTTQLDYFFEGTYCDIKDPNTNQWKTGLVLERTDTEAKIKYYYSNINKTIFTYNVSDAIDKDIAMFRKFTQEENYYFNNAYQKMKNEAVTNPKLFEAKAALKVLCSMKNFSNKEFDDAFESPLEIIQELRGKLYYIFLNIINDNFQFEYVEEQKAVNRRKNPKRAKEEEDNEKFDIENDISVNDVGDLINDYLNFSVKYLQWINCHPEIGRLLTFNYNFMLFDKECAFFSALYEFSSILSALFRENKFFMNYREQITDCLKDWGLEHVDFKISTTLYNLTKNKGIDKILKGILVNENQSLFVFEQIAKILASNGFVLFDDRSKIYDFYFNRVNNLTMNEQKFISFDDVEN